MVPATSTMHPVRKGSLTKEGPLQRKLVLVSRLDFSRIPLSP